MKSETDAINVDIEKLQQKLRATKLAKANLQTERANLAKHNHNKRIMEDMLSDRLNHLRSEYAESVEQAVAIDEALQRTTASLDRYKQLNAVNDAFYIWYSGPFATINAFRLGNLPNKPVEFTEINAALGQTALVLHIISSRAGIKFKRYIIAPLGSFPRIIKADDRKTSFPLFIDPSSFSFFPKRNFNQALLGLMDCIQEFGDYISSYDPTLSAPYRISLGDSSIGDMCFTYGGDDEVWTRALKFMLADVKWIIAWYCKHGTYGINETTSS